MAKWNEDHQDERYEHCRKVKMGYDRIVDKLSSRLRVTPRDEDGFPTHPNRLAKKKVNKMKQCGIARELGISHSNLRMIMSGQRKPNPELADRLSHCYL